MADANTEAWKVLREQAKVLGLKINPKWEIGELALAVKEAQEAQSAEAKAEFAEARKTPVFLFRDAWPVEDEKHLAGETIEVTIDIARKWIAAGVARDARPLPDL